MFETVNPACSNVTADGNVPGNHGCWFILKVIFICTSSKLMVRRERKTPNGVYGVH